MYISQFHNYKNEKENKLFLFYYIEYSEKILNTVGGGKNEWGLKEII